MVSDVDLIPHIGWHIAASEYANKIHAIFSKMFQLKEKVHPGNIRHVNRYLSNVWYSIVQLTMAIEPQSADEELVRRFEAHNSAEEEKLRKNLENIPFTIDSRDTLTLVTGTSPGTIERK